MLEDFGNLDVLVIGGGNAALCAAITALENGASVLILECSPKTLSGGNSRHTRNLRLAHETQVDPYTGAYPEEEMWNDYQRVLADWETRNWPGSPSTSRPTSSIGCGRTESAFNPRSPARFISAAPMPGSWAAARQ